MEDNFLLRIYLPTVSTMLKKADALLTLAQDHPDDQETLAACCIVILAETLDQGTRSLLAFTAEGAKAQGKDPDTSLAGQLMTLPLSYRVTELPRILSGGQLRLDHSSPHVIALSKLIKLRNALMHNADRADVTEQPLPFRTEFINHDTAVEEFPSSDLLSLVDKSGKMLTFYIEVEDEDYNQIGTYKVTQPKNPWLLITLDQANKYHAAVEIFYQEVLLANTEIKPSSIVIGV